MDVIVFQAVRRHGDVDDGCAFDVSTDGGNTFTPAQKGSDNKPFFSVPSLAALSGVTVRATPTDAKFWAGQGSFLWVPGTGLTRDAAPAEQFFIHGTIQSGADSMTLLHFHLGVFRDVSAQMLTKLNDLPDEWKDRNDLDIIDILPATGWLARAPAFYGALSPDVVSGSSVVFIPQNQAAAVEVTLLLRKGTGVVPALFAVSWPTALPRTLDAGPTPFLVFFTHQLNQNRGDFKHLDHYPDSWDYLHLAIYQYLNYQRDPLDARHGGHGWRGLCYQQSFSQKNVALVLPIGDATISSGEVGDCLDAAKLEEMLLEIQAFFFKRAGLFKPPATTLGRAAMASFSSGNNGVAMFLARSSNTSHRFYLDTLRELYSIDDPRDFAPGWANLAINWAGKGKDAAQKVIRMYGTHPPAYEMIHKAVVGSAAPAAPYASSTADGLRTITVLPEDAWRKALFAPSAAQKAMESVVHELNAATMLLDALRRSTGF